MMRVRMLSQTWQKDTASFTSLQELHAWLHATHLCYAVPRQVVATAAPDIDVTCQRASCTQIDG